jgi:hypothetical protein
MTINSAAATDPTTWCCTVATTLWLAVGDGEPNNFGDTRGSGVAGPLAGIIILLLAIGTVLLIRNMNKRLRRLPPSFDSDPIAPTSPAVEPKRGD